MTPITPLPTPPSRQDPANFAVRGDAFMAALPPLVTEINALASEMETAANNAADDAADATIAALEGSLVNTTTPQTIGGTKTFTASPVLPGNASTALQAVPLQQAEALAYAAAGRVGAIVYFPATTAPAGFIKANGALLSRTTYADLWAFAQASGNLAASDGVWQAGQFSPGDGSTTFRIPDGRGEHVRGWDDGRGVDSGRTIGTAQGDQNKAHNHGGASGGHSATHTHTGYTDAQGEHAHGGTMRHSGAVCDNGSSYPASNPSTTDNAGIHAHNVVTYGASNDHTHTIASDGGTEVRVRNVAWLACIKY